MPKAPLTYKIPHLSPSRGDQRRLTILEATLKAIASPDLKPITLEAIAKLCGVRRSHVAYYFKEPQSMIRSALEFAMSHGQDFAVQHISLASSARERLAAFVAANFEWFQKHPTHAAAFGLFNYYALCNPEYRKINTALSEMAEARLAAILLGGIAKPNKESEAKAREIAAALRALLVGSLARHFSAAPSAAYEAEKERITDQFLLLARELWA